MALLRSTWVVPHSYLARDKGRKLPFEPEPTSLVGSLPGMGVAEDYCC